MPFCIDCAPCYSPAPGPSPVLCSKNPSLTLFMAYVFHSPVLSLSHSMCRAPSHDGDARQPSEGSERWPGAGSWNLVTARAPDPPCELVGRCAQIGHCASFLFSFPFPPLAPLLVPPLSAPPSTDFAKRHCRLARVLLPTPLETSTDGCGGSKGKAEVYNASPQVRSGICALR